MAIMATVRRTVYEFTNLVLDATGRWTKEFDDATAGTLTADQVVTDGVITLQRAANFWMSFMPQGVPLVPVIYFDQRAATLPGQTPAGTAFVDESIPSGAVLTATPLQLLGAAGTIPVSGPTVVPGTLRQEIEIKLAIPAANPAPATGTYQGVIYLAGNLLATVVARIS